MACQEDAVESTEQNASSAPLSDYMEEEKPLLPGITVRAATFDQLIQLCVQSFCEYIFLFTYLVITISFKLFISKILKCIKVLCI